MQMMHFGGEIEKHGRVALGRVCSWIACKIIKIEFKFAQQRNLNSKKVEQLHMNVVEETTRVDVDSPNLEGSNSWQNKALLLINITILNLMSSFAFDLDSKNESPRIRVLNS